MRVSCSQELSDRASPIALSGCNGRFLDLGTTLRLHVYIMTLEKVIVVVKSLPGRKLFSSLKVGRDSGRKLVRRPVIIRLLGQSIASSHHLVLR